uniref:Trophoblast glycoprotein 1a n=2 Tax=Latimeria chalumnae TaxID=7897 RepID=H3B3W4_LATCH
FVPSRRCLCLLGMLMAGFLLLSPCPASCDSCPAPCECSEAARTVKCVLKDLKAVPLEIPNYTKNLFITGNQISRIGAGSFRGLENLVTLSLNNNRINFVESQAFASLPNLRFLDLSNNRLAVIQPDAFNPRNNSIQELNLSRSLYNHSAISDVAAALSSGGFVHLSKLELAENEIIYLPLGIFSSLFSLKHLDLRNNSIVDVKNTTLSGLDMEFLDLSLNAIKTFRIGTLNELKKQPHLQMVLKDNPFVCNCDIEDFIQWLNATTQVLDIDKLSCAFPRGLQNTSLLAVQETELGCHANDGGEIVMQTSYVFLGTVLGFIGIIFLFVLYLNRKGIKEWICNMRDACRNLMEGYHYRYEVDSDPRVTQVSTSDV